MAAKKNEAPKIQRYAYNPSTGLLPSDGGSMAMFSDLQALQQRVVELEVENAGLLAAAPKPKPKAKAEKKK